MFLFFPVCPDVTCVLLSWIVLNPELPQTVLFLAESVVAFKFGIITQQKYGLMITFILKFINVIIITLNPRSHANFVQNFRQYALNTWMFKECNLAGRFHESCSQKSLCQTKQNSSIINIFWLFLVSTFALFWGLYTFLCIISRLLILYAYISKHSLPSS